VNGSTIAPQSYNSPSFFMRGRSDEMFQQLRAGTRTYSAKPPLMLNPTSSRLSQKFG
jgi:hypothetical protein